MLFRNFLCSEYSEENIEFWIACEEYKALKSRQFAPRAQKIYSDFVTVHAPKEVNNAKLKNLAKAHERWDSVALSYKALVSLQRAGITSLKLT